VPSPRVRIVPGTVRHAYSLLVLTRAYFPYVVLRHEELLERLRRMPGGEHYYLVALLKGRTVGYAHLAFDRRKPSVRLLGIGVLDEHRRKGIARKLMRRCYAEARERGARAMNLLVRESNAPAIALYRKHGFALKGRLRKLFQGERVLVFSKPLKPPRP
jgi:ribosomal protein S18 acetylase RimI-like enzyme